MSLSEGNGELIPQIRVQIAIELMEDYGLRLAEEGDQLEISISAISKIFMRNGKAA